MDVEQLLERNRAWATRAWVAEPDRYRRLATGQRPTILWIGCSDSRVSPSRILDLPPGEAFVHRNVANVVAPSDSNCMSALQYAVEVLRVRHVIVCGHTGCGGIKGALAEPLGGPIEAWLDHVRAVRRGHATELDALENEERERRLAELNVMAQVRNVVRTDIVRRRWAAGEGPEVHGWMYSVESGRLSAACEWVPRGDGLRLRQSALASEGGRR